MSGTSTGGIIALGLTKPGADGKPDKSASDIVQLYVTDGTTIFPTSFLQGLHLGAIRGAKYDPRGLESTLLSHFGETRLKERGVLVSNLRPGVLRAITHLDVSDDDIDEALELIPEALGATRTAAPRAR